MPRIKVNDIELHYEEAGSGGEPIVFVPGWISTSRNWVETIPRLPLDRCRVYAFDLRGAGKSDRPASGYSPVQYAEDIAAAMTALGVETFHFVGHSMGGLVGIQLALEHAARLRKLILVAPAASGGLPAPELMEMVIPLCRDADRFRALTRMNIDPALPERLVDIIVEDATGCSEGHVKGSLEVMKTLNLSDRLREITAPTLMVVGDRDSLRPFNLEDAARIPNCALHVFYRAGHWIPFDVPQQLADVIVDFIAHGTTPAPDLEKINAQLQAILGAAPA